ncbi:Shaggy-related protein kinase eta [Orobanche hederae]
MADDKEMSAPVIDRNDAVTCHTILTAIGGKNGEHKQTVIEEFEEDPREDG